MGRKVLLLTRGFRAGGRASGVDVFEVVSVSDRFDGVCSAGTPGSNTLLIGGRS